MAGQGIEFEVRGHLPPLKNEALSMFNPRHPQAPRIRALLEAAGSAKLRDGFSGFGSRRIGMELVVSPVGAAIGDATNALGRVGDALQARRVNLDLTHLGELAEAFLFDDDAQIREVIYREEPGEAHYHLRFWEL